MSWKGWVAVALIVFLIIKAPQGSAHFVHTVAAVLSTAVTGIGTFLGSL